MLARGLAELVGDLLGELLQFVPVDGEPGLAGFLLRALGGIDAELTRRARERVASFRAQQTGEPFGMFDFTPVGATVAVAGLLFLVFAGWRLLPLNGRKADSGPAFNIEDYIAEAEIPAQLVSKSQDTSGAPFLLDLILNGTLNLLINTPIHTGRASDEGRWRSAAFARKIPLITTLAGARAAIAAIKAIRTGRWGVRPLQEYVAQGVLA